MVNVIMEKLGKIINDLKSKKTTVFSSQENIRQETWKNFTNTMKATYF